MNHAKIKDRLRTSYFSFFKKGNQRSLLAKKNIIASFVIKVITVLSTFVSYPVIVGYLNPTRYGIFLTLSSIIAWILLLDIGFGSGLKNRLVEAKAYNQTDLAKKYVSSTYAMLGLILIAIIIAFVFINPLIQWDKMLNVPPVYEHELGTLIWIVFLGFCLSFILRLITSIISADQKPAKVSFIDMVAQLLSLSGLYILTLTADSSLLYAASIMCFTPVVVYLCATIYMFGTTYKSIRPSFRYVDFSLAKSLMGLGVKFFVATISALVLFQTTNMFISYIVNPEGVTLFNIAFKLFGLGYTAIMIVSTPYWAAFSDAYALGDYRWMQKSFARLKQIFYFSLVAESLLFLFSKWIFRLWMGSSVSIPFSISLAVFVYCNLMAWLSICIYPINGIGKVKLQLYSSVAEILIIVPAALALGKCWGTPGIILAPILVSIPRAIWAPMQLNKLIKRTASGIWAK